MNSVYNHILLQNLKNLPKTGQSQDEIKKAFKGGLDQLELSGQIAILEKLQEKSEAVINSLSVLEFQASGLQKAFNLNVDTSKELALAFDAIGVNLNINTRLSKQYASDLAKYLPGQIKNINNNKEYSRELQVTNDVLQNRLGLDAKQAFSIRKLANLQGKSVAEIIKDAENINLELIKEQGYAGGLVDILSEIGNLNSDIAVQYGKNIPGSLEKSVISAKKFGLTLNDLYKTGEKMLDVENATNAAVEFQIFTGKKLEGQKYKNIAADYNAATIAGDAEKQMDIILDLVTSQAAVLEGTNFKAKQAIAKQTGLEVSQLTDILALTKEYNKIRPEREEGESDDAFKARIKQFELEKEAVQAKQKAELDAIQKIGKERSTQTTVQKLDDERETKKTKLVQDAGLGLSSQDLADGGSKLMKIIADGMASGMGELAVKTMKIFGAVEFTKVAITDFIETVKPLQGAESEKPNVVGEADPTRDAFVRVNDAILFDPNDKINIMASTSQASLDKTTANMAGGSSNNTSNIGQQVATAIAGMQFVVNNSFNGEEIITAMEVIQGNKMNA
tara:strand:+ start:4040 stop:5728 length:1689 start_codon:yes stop_codon:yes gene_type:complete